MAQRTSAQRARAWYWRYLRGHRRDVASALALGVVTMLSTLPIFLIMRWALDTAIPAHNERSLLFAAAIILTFRILGSAAAWLIGRSIARRVRLIAANMRVDVLAGLYHWRWQDYGALPDARAHSRMTTDAEAVELATQSIFLTLLPAAIPLTVYTALLFWFSWPLALGSAAVMALVRVATFFAQRNLATAIGNFQHAFEAMYASVARALQMITTARQQGTEETEVAGYRRRTLELATAGAQMTTAGLAHGQMSAITTAAAISFTLAAGGFAIASGAMSLGSFAAFLVGAGFASGIVNAIAGGLPLLLAANAALVRLVEFQDRATQDGIKTGGLLPDPASAIVFETVSFAYSSQTTSGQTTSGQPILDAASFRVEPGRVTAIAAPNGSGKTTILELALGLLQPSAGRITVGAHDIGAIDLSALRHLTGVVPQHPAFFAGTIRENIAFGRPDASDAELERAGWFAGLDAMFRASSQSLDTMMGDRGQMLSGGERQRIAIARAVVHQPKLLLLDEPTNHLDAAAVRLFIERLLQNPAHPTILIATHDARLLACADVVYDLIGGKLME